jgi:hypothetical protein
MESDGNYDDASNVAGLCRSLAHLRYKKVFLFWDLRSVPETFMDFVVTEWRFIRFLIILKLISNYFKY